jgi:hypothetical protein
MSCATVCNLSGYIKPELIAEFIRNNIDKTARIFDIIIEDQPYIKQGYQVEKGNILTLYGMIFYYHSNINLKENLEAYKSIGLGEMINSETTYISMDYNDYSIIIMKEIVKHFGGWIKEIDQDDDKEFYKVDKKEN